MSYFLKEELKLTTPNMQCAEPKRLVRVPFSRYVSKHPNTKGWLINDNYCVPITLDMLMDWKTSDIVEYSHNPVLKDSYKVEGKKMAVKEFLKDHDIKPRKSISLMPNGINVLDYGDPVDYTKIEDKDFFEITKLLVPQPCLHRILWTKNPPHFVRFSVCAFLTDVMGKRDGLLFFDKLAHEAEWNDRNNQFIRRYQVENIFDNRYLPYSCLELYNMGVCVGPECKKYEKYLNEKDTSVFEEDDDL